MFQSSGNLIQSTLITTNSIGIHLTNHSHGNIINDTIIHNNQIHGIFVDGFCTCNVIQNNTIKYNQQDGIHVNRVSRNNYITGNTMENNQIGIHHMGVSDGNAIYHNIFLSNQINAYDNSQNTWDGNNRGNYWDDYTGIDSDGDGIGDDPYSVPGGSNYDHYPLMEPWKE